MSLAAFQITNITWFCYQMDPTLEPHTEDSEGFPEVSGAPQEIPGEMGALGRSGEGCFGEGEGEELGCWR